MQRDVDPWVLGVAVLLQPEPEVVAVIHAYRGRNRIFDQLDLIAQVHLLVACAGLGLLDLYLLEEDGQHQLVRDVLLELQ